MTCARGVAAQVQDHIAIAAFGVHGFREVHKAIAVIANEWWAGAPTAPRARARPCNAFAEQITVPQLLAALAVQ